MYRLVPVSQCCLSSSTNGFRNGLSVSGVKAGIHLATSNAVCCLDLSDVGKFNIVR